MHASRCLALQTVENNGICRDMLVDRKKGVPSGVDRLGKVFFAVSGWG